MTNGTQREEELFDEARQLAGASGAVYDMLNEDKRNAVEIIVEERAGARDPEDRDGNLPELEDPTRR